MSTTTAAPVTPVEPPVVSPEVSPSNSPNYLQLDGEHYVYKSFWGSYLYSGDPKNRRRDREINGQSTVKECIQAYQRFDKFMRGLRLQRGGCFCRLVKKRHVASSHFQCIKVPYQDHGRLFQNTASKELVFVHQPYHCNRPYHCGSHLTHVHKPDCDSIEKIREVSEKFAENYGLTVTVSLEDSWHVPEWTVLVVYREKSCN
jgi:hypothetical protein